MPRSARSKIVRPGEVLLRKLEIAGVEWALIESDPKIEPELEECQGVFLPSRQACYVNRDEVPKDGYEYVLFHEIAHAVFFTTGGVEGLRGITGFDEEKVTSLEEYLVSVVFHGMWDTLKRNGLLGKVLRDA